MSVSLKNESYVKFRDFIYLCYRGVNQSEISEILNVSVTTLTSWRKLPIFDIAIAMLMVGGLTDAVRYNLEVSAGLETRDIVQRESA